MADAAIRVLVLGHSARERERLQRVGAADARVQVVACASDGAHAVEEARRTNANVVLVGCDGPDTHALEWIRHIMQSHPLPIIAMTPPHRRGSDEHAFEALEAGAVAVVPAPGPDGTDDGAVAEALRVMSEVKVVRRWGRAPASAPLAPQRMKHAAPASVEIVAIGASTGGPIVLKQVLARLPRSFPAPVVVVQHMAAGFVQGMAQWLNSVCVLPAQVAEHGIVAEPGRIYLAADGMQMRISHDRRIELDAGPPVNGHRPAVACLFESVRARYGRRALAVLLTGMGNDGAAELKRLKDAGAVTIAQDPATCVVAGMPNEAIRCGGATYVMSPLQIAAALPTLVGLE